MIDKGKIHRGICPPPIFPLTKKEKMNITISKKHLNKVFKFVKNIAQDNNLNHCFFNIDNGHFKIADYYHTIEFSLHPTKTKTDKQFPIDCESLRNFLTTNEKTISIKIDDDRLILSSSIDDMLIINSTTLSHFQPHNKSNTQKITCSLPLKELTKDLLKIKRKSPTHLIDYIQFQVEEDYTSLIACDGHRLIAKKVKNLSSQKPYPFSISYEIIKNLNTIIKDKSVNFYIDDNNDLITISNENCSFELAKEHNSLTFIEIIKKYKKDLTSIKIDKDIFIKHLTNLKELITKENPIIKLSVDDHRLTIDYLDNNNKTIKGCEAMAISSTKENFKFGINYNYLTDMLKTIERRMLQMQFNLKENMCFINDYTKDTYLIVGCKLQNTNKILTSK